MFLCWTAYASACFALPKIALGRRFGVGLDTATWHPLALMCCVKTRRLLFRLQWKASEGDCGNLKATGVL